MALHVILTAGGRLPHELEPHSNSKVKALLPLGGATLLTTAVRAAREVNGVGRIVAVGNAEIQAAAVALGVEYVREVDNVVDNILRAFEHLGGADHDYLIVSPDLPFVDAAALNELITAASGQCELGFPLITRADFLAHFPGAPNRFEHLDGDFKTMGSVIYVTGPMLRKNIPLARDLYRWRKQPHRLAMLLGFGILWAFLVKRLRTAQLEERFSRLMDGRVRGLSVRHAGLAYDVDHRVNYDYAVKHLGK